MNGFFAELALGIRSNVHAFRFLHQHKLYPWLIVPIGINVLLFLLTLWAGWEGSDWLAGLVGGWLPEGQSWLVESIRWTVLILARLAFFFIYALLYKELVLIVMAPLLALLSERADELKTGQAYPFSWNQLIKDVIRGVRLAIRNLFLELLATLVLFLLGFVPVIGLIAPFVLLGIQSYFFGFSMLDYSCERYRMNTRQSVLFVRKHGGLAIGLGICFYGMFLIPYVGWVFAPVIGIIAGTLSFLKIKKPGDSPAFKIVNS